LTHIVLSRLGSKKQSVPLDSGGGFLWLKIAKERTHVDSHSPPILQEDLVMCSAIFATSGSYLFIEYLVAGISFFAFEAKFRGATTQNRFA
jgi:hypothetical protein